MDVLRAEFDLLAAQGAFEKQKNDRVKNATASKN